MAWQAGRASRAELMALENGAFRLVSEGRPRWAEPALERTLEAYRRAVGDDNIQTARIKSALARVKQELGRSTPSAARLREAQELFRQALLTVEGLKPKPGWIGVYRSNYGGALVDTGAYEEAESQLLISCAELQASQ